MTTMKKIFSMIALLLMTAVGAWAQEESLLTTVTPTGKSTYSQTPEEVVTVTLDNNYTYNSRYGWLWMDGSVTVAANEGYTITKCVFRQNAKDPITISAAPFAIHWEATMLKEDESSAMDGVTSIEVYGYETPTTTKYAVTLADGTDDAANWTIDPATAEEGQTVTIKYNGTKKVKSIKAVKKAAATPLDNTTTAWTAGAFAIPAGGLTYADAITVTGDVTLTLTDGETLTLNKGISIADGATLTVLGGGTMNVNGTSGSTASTVAGTGTLVLTSGTLNAKGGNGNSTPDAQDYKTGADGGVGINGAVTVAGGTLTATGGNGGNCGRWADGNKGGAGGAAISGDVTMTSGTLTATGGNGGDAGIDGDQNTGGAGGAAINGALTINGGTVTTTNGNNGGGGQNGGGNTVGAGGKAVSGTVTDNR